MEMLEQMQKMELVLNKKKQNLQSSKNKAIKTIYNLVLANKPIKAIHQELARIINNKEQLKYFTQVSTMLDKRIKNVRKDLKNGVFYDLHGNRINNISDINKTQKVISEDDYVSLFAIFMIVKKGNWSASSEKIQNEVLREDEVIIKDKVLDEMFKDPNKVFFVASKHADSAKDHKDYQGKIYYNANYDKRDERITRYIKRYNLMSVQEVTSKPIYFVTRPNCRHYFKHYTYAQVASGSYYVPTRKVGMRKLGTRRFEGTDNQIKAQRAIQYYSDRLKTLEELNRVHSNYILRADIAKCRDLIKKWKKEL